MPQLDGEMLARDAGLSSVGDRYGRVAGLRRVSCTSAKPTKMRVMAATIHPATAKPVSARTPVPAAPTVAFAPYCMIPSWDSIDAEREPTERLSPTRRPF